MRVLVTFAVEAEFAPWRRLRNLREVIIGMGAENARRVVNAMMEQPYAMCIASGFAGALKPEHAIGSILVAEAVQQIGKAKTVQSSRNLVLEAQRDGAFRAKMFLTSESVVRTAE